MNWENARGRDKCEECFNTIYLTNLAVISEAFDQYHGQLLSKEKTSIKGEPVKKHKL